MKNETTILFGGGGILVAAGIVMMISGSGWGALALVAGIGLLAFGYAKLMRGAGYNPNQGTINGLNGQGKQQSEAVRDNQPASGEQNAEIWEQITK